MKGFMDFIRDQGVVGLAVGFILGGAISKLIETFVVGIVDPAIALLFDTNNLTQQTTRVGEGIDAVVFSWGAVVALMINLLIVGLVVYYGAKGLGLVKSSKSKTAAKKTSRATSTKKTTKK